MKNQKPDLNKMVKVLKDAEEKLGKAMGEERSAEVYAIYDELCQLSAKCLNLRAAQLRALKAAATGGA